MCHRIHCALLVLSCLLGCGCDEEPEPPTQEAVEQAWQRADRAVAQAVSAQADVKHIARLRDIDRLRYEADVAELSVQVSTLRGLAMGLALALLAAMVWLAVEIRRRRILSAVIRHAGLVAPAPRSNRPTDDGIKPSPA